jgi:acyl carrier protein
MQDCSASVSSLSNLIVQLREGQVLPDIGPATRFIEDLGLASLELVALVYMCEETFQVPLATQMGLLASLRTVGQTVEAIQRLQPGNTDSPLAALTS